MPSKEVESWLKRTRKRGPFYLLDKKPIRYFYGWNWDVTPPVQIHRDGHMYKVVWKHDGKVRIGLFKDGMHTRYGADTWGTLTGDTIAGFWQIRPGALSEEEMQVMLSVAKGECTLETFDPADLKDLSS